MAKYLFLLASCLVIFAPTSYARLLDNAFDGDEEHADSDLKQRLLVREEDPNESSVFIFSLPAYKELIYLARHESEKSHRLMFYHRGAPPVPPHGYYSIPFTKRENDVQDSFDLVPENNCLNVQQDSRQLYAVECSNPHESSYILRYYEKQSEFASVMIQICV